ncbi:TetR/AcrR family transcriptional regulator [uncultured Corynebacterium sp.]|uniref:TetR/AcrR family transcriptional regulator n=1 Tax=uncultured Corynebacterium sp. TaxID=159447 RepID=UPI0025DDFAC4|nr:TetR family transcriptional regulator [uncultured Corynebacterium sp.]
MQLNRETILNASFDILHEYGLGDLSMRRLARNLEVAPGALYWHFPSKQALLGAVADKILATPDAVPADVTSPGLDTGLDTGIDAEIDAWRARALDAAATLLDRLLSTRDGAEIVSAALATGTLEHNPVEPVTVALAGAPGGDPALASWVLVRYLLGAATELQTAHATEDAAVPDTGAVVRILAGVELILDGVAASAATRG